MNIHIALRTGPAADIQHVVGSDKPLDLRGLLAHRVWFDGTEFKLATHVSWVKSRDSVELNLHVVCPPQMLTVEAVKFVEDAKGPPPPPDWEAMARKMVLTLTAATAADELDLHRHLRHALDDRVHNALRDLMTAMGLDVDDDAKLGEFIQQTLKDATT